MVTKILKVLAVGVVLIFVGIQFFRPEFSNPPIQPGNSIEDIYTIPGEVSAILKNSCSDCHSNKTAYPWYSKVAPLSWGMSDHIKGGRAELNFSEWGTYDEKKRTRKLKKMCSEVVDGSMPHNQYVWIHWDAALDETDKKALCNWTDTIVNADKQRITKDAKN